MSMTDILIKNYVDSLAEIMIANGATLPDNYGAQDVLSNLKYLAKTNNEGQKYIPLHEKRLIEKIVFGITNTAFDYDDKTDVYFEEIKGVKVCTANVRLVRFDPNGNKYVVGHGFHSMSLSQVFPMTPMLDDEKRRTIWKATVIGGAKSRALHDAGIGLEFYGDKTALDEMDDGEANKAMGASESGLPDPAVKKENKKSSKAKNTAPAPATPDLDVARSVVVDSGSWKGVSLGVVLDKAPAHLVGIARTTTSENVKNAAVILINSREDLKAQYEAMPA